MSWDNPSHVSKAEHCQVHGVPCTSGWHRRERVEVQDKCDHSLRKFAAGCSEQEDWLVARCTVDAFCGEIITIIINLHTCNLLNSNKIFFNSITYIIYITL